MVTVHKWRIYCNTENDWVESWCIEEPTKCINNDSHTVNLSSTQVLFSMTDTDVTIVNSYKDTFDSDRVVQQTPLIELKSFSGISSENRVDTTGTGSVTAQSGVDSEILLSIDGVGDSACIKSSKRGYYIAGLSSEVGVALRIPQSLDTNSVLKFGYFDNNNGYYYKITAGNAAIGIMNDGVETIVTRSNFNVNKLDGTEDNLVNIDLADGNIFRIDFTWYGFGQVKFGVIATSPTRKQKLYTFHTHQTIGSTSCGNPNLPINVQLISNGSAIKQDVYLAGRQYSILGRVNKTPRTNMFCVRSTDSGTGINHFFSLKYDTDYISYSCAIKSIKIFSTNSIDIHIVKNASLSNNTFFANTCAESSALLLNDTATVSGGTMVKKYCVFEGQPMHYNIRDFDIYEDDVISFTWQSTIATGNSVTFHVEWEEIV